MTEAFWSLFFALIVKKDITNFLNPSQVSRKCEELFSFHQILQQKSLTAIGTTVKMTDKKSPLQDLFVFVFKL